MYYRTAGLLLLHLIILTTLVVAEVGSEPARREIVGQSWIFQCRERVSAA